MNKQDYIIKLKELLVNHFKQELINKNIQSGEIALAFSGGLDSSILAKILLDLGIRPKAYVIGVEGCNDFESAEQAAKELNLDLIKVTLSEEQIEKDLPIQTKILKKLYESNKQKIKSINQDYKEKLNPVSVSSNYPLYFVEKFAKEKYIVSGLGADTLLGGFYKYLRLSKQESEKQMIKESKDLLEFDYLEDLETANYLNKKIIMPFVDKEIGKFCLNIPYELKIKNKIRKYILIELAKHIKLSPKISLRQKKSAQYGSGIMKIMKKIAKKHNMNLIQYIQHIAQ